MTARKHKLSQAVRPRRGSLVVERDGSQVSLLIQCDDEYAAMELYDRAVAMAREGHLRLDLTLGETVLEH